MTENPTVWKSNNQGDKEETFMHTGRRGGDGQMGGEDLQQGVGWWTGQSVDRAVPHSCADELGGKAGERNRPCNPGLQCGEIKPQTSE